MKTFTARETGWLQELDGVELAEFWQRALAFAIDGFTAFLVFFLSLIVIDFAISVWRAHHGLGHYSINIKGESRGEELLIESLVPAVYFGLTTWLGKGRSPGKRLLRIRVVSLVHRHLTLWHAIERALGYAAAALEFGFGFAQFFIHPYRRTVQDRIAETIVVKEASYRRLVLQRAAIPAPLEMVEAAPGEAAIDSTGAATPDPPADVRAQPGGRSHPRIE
jgi:uncharacterized RDD family membrane protein YckC